MGWMMGRIEDKKLARALREVIVLISEPTAWECGCMTDE
jgi:hypothetical protein